jgi:hypothetical protein
MKSKIVKTSILLVLFFMVLFGNLTESYCYSHVSNRMLNRQKINGIEFLGKFDFPPIRSLSNVGDSFSDFSVLVVILLVLVVLLIGLQWFKQSLVMNLIATVAISFCMYDMVIFTNYGNYYLEQCSAQFTNFTFHTDTPFHTKLFFLFIAVLIYSWIDFIRYYFKERKSGTRYSTELLDN